MLELGGEGSVGRGAGPVIGPGTIAVGTLVDHGLDGEAHTGLGNTNGLVLRVVRNVRSAVEQLVDTVTAVALDYTAVPGLGVLLDHITRVAEQHARLHQLDGLVQALTRRLNHAHRIRVGLGLVTDIVGLVDVSVETVVVQRDINVDNVAVLEGSLVGDTVADNLVDGRADRLGEVVVVEGRGVRL